MQKVWIIWLLRSMFRLHLILNAVQILIACTLLRALRKTLHRQHGISMEFLIPQESYWCFYTNRYDRRFTRVKMIKVLFDGKIKPFPSLISLFHFTTVSNISGQSTIRLDTNYTVNETLTWRPNWADAEVANKVIGVGLAFNFKRTHRLC